ncbi:hypothetical protein TNCV_2474161 [Trichonephila clavipes]|nr:hypothetical protein TNCV_2474161 [Trichonephila clavipes]
MIENWVVSAESLRSTALRFQFRKEFEIPKELRSCISGYRDIYKQLMRQSSSQKLNIDFMVPKNKSMENVSSSDESDFELTHHRKMRALDYDVPPVGVVW